MANLRRTFRRSIRGIFGDSNRRGHLRMSKALSMIILGMALWHTSAFALVMAGFCFLQEYWASADRDIEERRLNPCPYWMPYAVRVKHRGRLSHGIILGTLARFVYGYAPVLALWFSTAWALPSWPVLAALLGAWINDLGHLVLDL